MKGKALLIAVIIILILSISSVSAVLADSDFTASLSVSDTSVPAGTNVTSAIFITNLDNAYGADVVVSYSEQVISSFYIAAGQSKTVYHNITINQTTNVFYKVYASHGPDISKTKNTNTVTVYVEQPSTPTPNITVEPNTPTPEVTEAPITPEVTYTDAAETEQPTTPAPETDAENEIPTPVAAEILETDVIDRLGWGMPVSISNNKVRILEGFLKENIFTWLGINKSSDNHLEGEAYRMRRLVFGSFMLLLVSILMFVMVIIIGRKRK